MSDGFRTLLGKLSLAAHSNGDTPICGSMSHKVRCTRLEGHLGRHEAAMGMKNGYAVLIATWRTD